MDFKEIRNIAKQYIGYFLSIISLYLLISIFYEHKHTVSAFPLNTLTIGVLAFSLLVVLIGHTNLVFTWFIQLANKYPALGLGNAFIAVGLSQIAKYMPGNIAHLLGRALLINKYVNKKDVALTLLFESLTLSLTAVFFGYLWGRKYAFPVEITDFYALCILIVLMFLTIFLIAFLRQKTTIVFLTYRTFISIFLINCISFLLHGSAIYLIAVHLVHVDNISLLQCTYGFALSFLIGYILPGAPGGIGVREYSFVVLFNPFILEVDALQIIIIYRLISVVGDAIIFILTMMYKRRFSVDKSLMLDDV